MKNKLLLAIACLFVVSCNRSYQEPPFAGMKGRVQEVKIWHMIPEMWYAGMKGSDIQYINSVAYDIDGNEICSALLDSTEHIMRETENYFVDGVCMQSSLKAGGRTISKLTFLSKDGGTTEYEKTIGYQSSKMSVRESSFLRRYKSTVIENGNVTQVSVTKTDRHGLPIRIETSDPINGNETIEKNKFDENGNIIEKLVINNGVAEDTLTYQYFDFDEHGNWREARTYNLTFLPVEVLVREIKYWE